MYPDMSSFLAIALAALCTCGAITVAIWHIYMHLRNYTEPTYQRYTVRIIFMVPVYATMSFLSLVMRDKSVYFSSVRDIYEAWVIYNFLSLCLAWIGGPGAATTSLNGRVLKPSWYLMTCCLPAIPLDGRFIRRCKQGCLQFVILKPLLVAATFILYSKSKYEDGNFSADQSYLYITIIYTISYSLALFSLVVFYVACKDLLRPFKPVPKFIIIKSVVFLTYWQVAISSRLCMNCDFVFLKSYLFQGVLVFLAAKSGLIENSNDAADVQNFIICIEMALAAAAHLYAFPYKEYAEAKIGAHANLTDSITHALNFKDLYYDTVHQFAPTYHNYVLYSDGSQEAQTYMVRTFVPTGQEMELSKSKQSGTRKDETLVACSSDSGGIMTTKGINAGQNLLLFDPQNPFAVVPDNIPTNPMPGFLSHDFDPNMSVPPAK